MSAERKHRFEPFWDERLLRHENKAVEMALNGFSLSDIADEMAVAPRSATQYLSRARGLGVAVPRLKNPGWARVSIARLVHVRRMLQASGVTYGLYPLIAERVGMTAGCVRKRLWEYDQQQKAGQSR